MKVVRSSVVDNGVVTLDDTEFIDCEFNGCEIRYSGGSYALRNSPMNNPKWVFTGSALRTVELLKQLGLLKGDPSEWNVAPLGPVFDSGDIA